MSWKSQTSEWAISKASNIQCSEPCHQGLCFIPVSSNVAHTQRVLNNNNNKRIIKVNILDVMKICYETFTLEKELKAEYIYKYSTT